MSESKKESMGMLALVLFLITFITALLLGVVNQVTSPLIAKNNENTRAAGNGLKSSPALSSWKRTRARFLSDDKNVPSIQNIYVAQKDGEDVGYCMEVLPSGFGGTLTVVVGINSDGTVAGAKVTKHSETPGLGAKSQSDPTWIVQFAGKPADGSLAVTKDGGDINAITGATITSRAVTKAVNTAATYVQGLAS